MKLLARFLFSLLLVLTIVSCAGGHHSSSRTIHRVYLLDCSASVRPKALEDAVQQIDLVAAGMQRGDRISVIPITSSSDTNAQGNILRMEVPLNRQPYDHDLTTFRRTFHQALQTLHNHANAHLYKETDILGSVDLAAQEFATDDEPTQKRLIIFSDFIEEDGTFDFRAAPALAGASNARQLASRLAKNSAHIPNASVFLGSLQSTELERLSKSRRFAIREFWLEYFKNEKDHAVFATDGPGMSAIDGRDRR